MEDLIFCLCLFCGFYKCKCVLQSIKDCIYILFTFTRPSHILLAIGVPKSDAWKALRISVGRETTKEEIDKAIQEWKVAIYAYENTQIDTDNDKVPFSVQPDLDSQEPSPTQFVKSEHRLLWYEISVIVVININDNAASMFWLLWFGFPTNHPKGKVPYVHMCHLLFIIHH